jgi:hypothetical protein
MDIPTQGIGMNTLVPLSPRERAILLMGLALTRSHPEHYAMAFEKDFDRIEHKLRAKPQFRRRPKNYQSIERLFPEISREQLATYKRHVKEAGPLI